MDDLTFELEIPDRWMLWRIYNIEGDEDEDGDGDERKVKDGGWDLRAKQQLVTLEGHMFLRHHDPMDVKGFDEASSFPTIKPDRDLFGPPLRRTRKQRGWHHVKRWPPAVLASAAPQHYATGADIPQELFDNIVAHTRHRRDVKASRLVCRRWETLSLYRMFGSLILRNHQAVSTLSRLVDQRMACSGTLAAYPAPSFMKLEMQLQYEEGWRPWVDLPRLLQMPERDTWYTRTEWSIHGPLPAGRRLTSVYLSSPCRPHWRPLNIHRLSLWDIHFRKLGDLIRLLRELPSLAYVSGKDMTWDGEEYPRMTSFIPCSHPHSHITYTFNNPKLNKTLVCALALSGSRPVAESDADILYALVSVLNSARSSVNYPKRFKSGLYIPCRRPWPDVHVAFRPTHGTTQSVQSITFDFHHPFDRADGLPIRMDEDLWKSILGFVEKLVRDTRPEILFLFPSAESAASFLREVSILDLAPFVASGRVKCIIETKNEKTLKLVKSDGNGGWRVLATRSYQSSDNNCDNAGSRSQVLHELAAWVVRQISMRQAV